MFSSLLQYFSYDIGIDLGTANTLVYVKGKGIIIREPSVVAVMKKSREVLAVGYEAKKMLGKTPANIEAIRPLRDGVISDFNAAQKMISYFIKQIHDTPTKFPRIPKPRVVIGIPSGATSVERKAVVDAAKNAGAREVHLLYEPMAAAIGSGIDVTQPNGAMIVDMGGGTSEIAVISLGGLVVNKSIRVAGDEFDVEIVNFAKNQHNLLLGERTAEEIKFLIGNVYPFPNEDKHTATLRGRDLKSGLPRAVEVSSAEIRAALRQPLNIIIDGIKDAIEETPADLMTDIVRDGIVLAGGTSLLRGLDKLLSEELRVPVNISKDPITCVVRGCGKVLDDQKLLNTVKI